jgi:anti-anti-sigma factor
MTTPLTLKTDRRDDGTVVLTANGEIDLSNIDTFTEALNTVSSSGAPVTVDLGAVQYLDSGAINALFTYAERIRLIVHPLLMRVLKISGLTELTTVEPAPNAQTG